MANGNVRILSLDGGGAKGFYTLAVLREVEGMMGNKPLCEHFRLIFGTSTGSIIAALLAHDPSQNSPRRASKSCWPEARAIWHTATSPALGNSFGTPPKPV